MTASNQIKWAATLSHVREVSLLGSADLAYWADRLKAQDLRPIEHEGKARVMILSADARFMGLVFRELSISVAVRPHDNGAPDAAFLLGAWNCRRFFAFCERVFFKTPYSYGDVRVGVSLPTSLRLIINGTVHFAAEMMDAGGLDRRVVHEESSWEGPVFFPTHGAKPTDRKLFFAALKGRAQTYPFESGHSLRIQPVNDGDALSTLLDSRFTPQQWSIRQDAIHSKSKTYRRTEAPFVPSPPA